VNAGARNVVIDATAAAAFAVAGNTLTIKSSAFVGNMTTTGTISLANGATFTGTRTDANGTISSATFSLTNLQTGTEVRVYRASDEVEIAGVEATAGSTFAYNYLWSANVPVIVTVHKPGFVFQRITTFILTSANQAIPIFQQADRTYANPL
jgi:hypothetical protein